MPRDESSKNAANKNGSTPTTPTSPNSTKFCHVIKRPDFDGYGFNLHTEKVKPGQYIGKIDAGSPAEAAGLKEGDRIIEVNGVNIAQESHKQVVQRIKAIANEVRLLLIDVDGVGNVNVLTANASATKTTTTNTSNSQPIANTNGNSNASNGTNGNSEYQGIVQEMPGASANISSISMKSTKRSSSASGSESSSPRHSNSKDVPDRAGIVAADVLNSHKNDNNNMMNKMSTPPPPSAAIATVPITPPPPKEQSASSPIMTAAVTNSNGGASNANVNANASARPIQPAGLQLQMTAAEMRAKLMARKKYDPKNENVDLRKKFEIIQKL